MTEKGFMNTLHYASPLILTGLAIAITFKANLYNMGVEGQMLLGGFFAGITGAYLNISNPFISKLICFLVAIICGMLFALIPAILKAKCNVNEMVVTLMLNYAVSKTLEFLTTGVFKDKSAGYVATPTIKEDVMFKRFGASRMTMFFVIAMIILVIMYFVMKKSKLGYEITAIGKNPEFAEQNTEVITDLVNEVVKLRFQRAGEALASHLSEACRERFIAANQAVTGTDYGLARLGNWKAARS